ncbi:probable calcium-binding protein CML41 [Cajanus cajan]|uniref:Calcium-binding protein CML41 n=1 Tax=Cajanus cajan TaxID=3821 RepID=A0A151RBP0_CAJCA|nr:probable calcium-binding protein CML41 [Cajanus cajan]KYP39899.1 putative calcium-binding protein CML41 [Cajanus cajan]
MTSAKWLFKITFPCLTPPRPKSLPDIAGDTAAAPTTPPPLIGPSGPKDDDRHRLKDVFDHLDIDKDGKISSTELMDYFASVGESLSRKVAERVVNEFDSDGDELLDFGDFVKLMKQEESEELEDVLRSAFQMFEVEKGCGCITPQGLQQMLRLLGDVKSHDECAAMIRPFDLDGNGFLDFHEFQQMMSPA